MRKRIAVLVAQVDETTQNRFLIEFIKQAYVYDYDVCIFTMYQKYQETALRDIGDSNIFKLINFDLFDAAVMLTDTILVPGLAMTIQKKIKATFHGPVLIVDKESPYFDSVIMDHYTPVHKIVDHLIERHNYKDIAFLGGKEGHPHSVQRLNAFLDSMAEHNIPVQDKWIYHGNYWYDSAEEFVDILLKDRDNLPRAIVCANDFMAIGAATKLTENGVRVPEDVAITGYDSKEDGKHSPSPLTSADIPAAECGQYCMMDIHARLNGKKLDGFKSDAPIFIGDSCGCKHLMEMVPKALRSRWRTQQSSRSMFSDFNHILEDLLSQNDLTDFLNVIKDYSYQIRPFYSFDICLNDGFMNPSAVMGERSIRIGYAEKMYRVLRCNEDITKDVIDLNDSFDTSLMIPELKEERDYPTTFIFNPLYFDDRCFGYTVLNHGPEVCLYKEDYRIWMRNIMQGMEAFYRQGFMLDLIERIKSDQVRDTMTGLYNYEGFIQKVTELMEQQNDHQRINIIAIDVKGMKAINEIYGRECGVRAIRAVSRFMQNNTTDDDISCRLFNDEFLVAMLDYENSSKAKYFIDKMLSDVNNYRLLANTDYQLQIHVDNLLGRPTNEGELELLVNRAINIKDHKKKINNPSDNTENSEVMEEIKRNQLVMEILNDNLLTYYYQPIVSVADGSIYGYEALMRCEKENISPLQIIQSASYLKRLNDIERATLLNVTSDVEKNLDLFGDAKVFLNSLPGIKISKDDDDIFVDRLSRNKGRFVIEFTEESELGDERLEELKAKYAKDDNQIAVDDFGAGYSNVNNLLRYSPHYVKIDRMLVSDIANNPQKQHMVKSIVEYAHDNNIYALAEGIETREELKECIYLGMDLIQGFYTGKATRVPLKEIDINIRGEIARYRQLNSWNI